MPDLSLCRLSERELADAYPLVRAATRVSVQRWTAFARALIASGGGVIGARGSGGCLHGIAIYRPLDSLRHRRCLHVELLAAFRLTRGSPVHALLNTALDRIADELACESISLTLSAGRNRSHARWREPGLRLDTIGFARAPAPDRKPRPARPVKTE